MAISTANSGSSAVKADINVTPMIDVMLQLPRITWIRFGVWLLLGLVIYFTYGMRNSRLAKKVR